MSPRDARRSTVKRKRGHDDRLDTTARDKLVRAWCARANAAPVVPVRPSARMTRACPEPRAVRGAVPTKPVPAHIAVQALCWLEVTLRFGEPGHFHA